MKHAYGPYFDLVRRRGMKYVTLTNLGLGIMQRTRFLRFEDGRGYRATWELNYTLRGFEKDSAKVRRTGIGSWDFNVGYITGWNAGQVILIKLKREKK